LAETNRLGRKGERGFYRYQEGKEKGVDESIYAELGDSVPAERREFEARTIRERTILAMINEAARALEDGIVSSAGEVDLAMITGTGFPPFRGGLLRYADSAGIATLLEKLLVLEESHGIRFQPAPFLRELAIAGRGFYG
jgi:3-hydroxyacyl-CoA dehydrogenase/enoyl-CoA hydratase/3-hydroxybutyryl-CoA epimerase